MTPMPASKKILPYLALAVSILSISCSAFFVRWADAPAPVMGFYRIGLATLFMTPFFVRREAQAQTRLRAPDLRPAILILPVLAGLGSGFDHYLWNASLKLTPVANAVLLGNTAPLFVGLAAWALLRERTGGLFWLGLVLSMGGAVAVLSWDFLRHPVIGWGDLLALSSSLFYAAFYIFSQRSRRHLATLPHVWITSLSGALLLLVLAVVTRSALGGYPPKTYLFFLGAALIPQLTGYLGLGYALGHLPASVVSPTMLAQPVLTALLAIPVMGEPLQPVQWIGGLLVLGGIYLVHRSRERAPEALPGD
jgi:drug/metabolite transporter (DMT)-like permease